MITNQTIKNAKRFGIDLTKPGIKVLDFGCGKGSAVRKLRELGVDAYGVDINKSRIDEAKDILLEKENIEPEEIFHQIDERLPFQDNTFDYVYANQVLEHVEDLDVSIREVARITKKSGFFYSSSPAKYIVTEPHVLVPFAHWLPAGKFRARYLSFCFKMGIGQSNGLSGKQQDLYLKEQTFYRSRKRMNAILCKYFQKIEFVGWQQLQIVLRDKYSVKFPNILLLNSLAESLIARHHEHRILMGGSKICNQVIGKCSCVSIFRKNQPCIQSQNGWECVEPMAKYKC